MLRRDGSYGGEAIMTHVSRQMQAGCSADPLVRRSKFAELVDRAVVGACCVDYAWWRNDVLCE